MRRLLRRHFSDAISDATLLAVLFGTSLFHYATFDSMWSHAFSFALCAALFERCDAWREQSGASAAAGIGVIAGVMVLVRHTNALVPAALCSTLLLTDRAFRRLAWMPVLAAGACLFPQLWVYHHATRHWLVRSYGTLGFAWTSPHLAGVLIGPQKGLFFWAPILLASVAGLAWFPPALRRWRAAIVIVFVADTYLIASWWDWQFGASYGHRGFVDLYPLLAPGLAAAFARVPARLPARAAAVTIVAALCALSMFQMLQYWHGVLPMSDVTWTRYKEIFLRPW